MRGLIIFVASLVLLIGASCSSQPEDEVGGAVIKAPTATTTPTPTPTPVLPQRVEWAQTEWSSGEVVGWSWKPDAPATADGGIRPEWRHCEEEVHRETTDLGRSLCTDEPLFSSDPGSCNAVQVGTVRPETAVEGLSGSALSLIPNGRNTAAGKSNHLILGANLPELAGRIGAVTYSTKVSIPSATGGEQVETGPEISVQHTVDSVTMVAGLQHVTNRWSTNQGWQLWVEGSTAGGVWVPLLDDVEAPLALYVPGEGSTVTITLAADFRRGVYQTVTISSAGEAATIDVEGVRMPTKFTDWAANLVLTIEAQNLRDCDENFPDRAVSGQVVYDDLSFVGEVTR